MAKIILGLLCLISFSIHAQITETNELCLKAGLTSYKEYGIDDLHADNLCLKKTNELTPKTSRNLSQIIEIHQKLADLFGIRLQHLFVEPIELDMMESTLGSLYSYVSGTSIAMGVYPNDDYKFNLGVYAHELGHVLSAMDNPKLPPSLTDLDYSNFFIETFADLISTALYDSIITVQDDPSCIDRTRYITTAQTYNMPVEYFSPAFGFARVQKCCESASFREASKNLKGLCVEMERMGDFRVSFSRPFEPLLVSPSDIDNHQIGIPFLSFIKDLAKSLEMDVSLLFQLGFNQRTYETESYTCNISLKGEQVDSLQAELHTARTFLKDLKERLDFSSQLVFDLLFQKHAIEKGLIFADRSNASNLKMKIFNDLSSDDSAHTCKGRFLLIGDISETKCIVSCQKNEK